MENIRHDDNPPLFLSPIKEPPSYHSFSSLSKKLTNSSMNSRLSPETCFRRHFLEYSPSFRSLQRELVYNYPERIPNIPFHEESYESYHSNQPIDNTPLSQPSLLAKDLHIRCEENDLIGVKKRVIVQRDVPHKAPVESVGKKTCNCKKSQCLKLYCECFAAGTYCQGCTCVNCHNTSFNTLEVAEAKDSVSSKNPVAFKKRMDGTLDEASCNCSRSNCLKKYCECFKSGIRCGDLCTCTGCKNKTVLKMITSGKGAKLVRKSAKKKGDRRKNFGFASHSERNGDK